MAIILTRLAVDATIGTQERGGPTLHRAMADAAVMQSTAVFHSFDFSADTLVKTDTASGVASASVLAFHPTLDQVAIWSDTGTRVTVFNYNPATGALGSAIATSASAGGIVQASCLAFSPDGSFIAVARGASPWVSVISWNGAAFGSWAHAAGQLDVPGGTFNHALAWHPAGTALAVASDTAHNGLRVYPFSGGALGSPASPAVQTGTAGQGVGWSPDGLFVALGVAGDPFVAVYSWNGSALGAAVTPTTSAPGAGSIRAVVFDKTQGWLIAAGTNADNGKALYAYAWNGSTLTGRVEALTQPGVVGGLALTNNNTRLLAWDTSEDLHLYSTNLTDPVEVDSLSPDGGDPGDTVTITGSGFIGPATVTFGGIPATGVVVVSGTQITAVVPAGVIGSVTITVTIPNGQSGSLAGGFTYDPTVSAIAPSGGAIGSTVTITGTGFIAGATVTFGATPATGVVVVSSTQITAVVPAGTGTVAITVTNPNTQSGILAGAFTYSAVAPAHPTPLGGGPQPWQSTEREALRVLATARGFGLPAGGESQALEVTLQQLLDEIRGFSVERAFPTDADRLFDLIFEALAIQRPRHVTRNAMLALIEANLPG